MLSTVPWFDLRQRRILVTGASRGIGLAIADAYAALGAEVIISARSDLSPQLVALRMHGGKVHGIAADISEAVGRAKLWNELQFRDLLPDVLVNNAGIIRRAPFAEMTFNDWHTVIETNLNAVFDLSQRFARHRIAAGLPGKIINILSLLSHEGGIRVASYTAAKSGLLGLTRAMANDLAPHNIQVNGIVPGYIETDNTLPLRLDPERNTAILNRIPAGRWGQPEDLQGAAILLASPASDYMTGSEIVVDGGWTAR
jgi:2-dehydro-3-deoxy-D-gluconate 5-dehydrogenase